jgi:hypothetical protein
MQRAKATVDTELADPGVFGEPAEPVDDGFPVHAAGSRESETVATIAAVRDDLRTGVMPAVLRRGR